MMPATCRTAFTAFAFSLLAGAVSAQQEIDLTGYRECGDCELAWVRVAALGDAAGDGIVESAHPRLARSPSGAYAMFGERHIKLFDAEGRFLRRIGSEGGGPGEYRSIIDLELVGDTVLALDYDGARLTATVPTGEVLGTWRVPVSPGRIRAFGADSIVVGSMGRAPDADPLHLVVLNDSDAEVVRNFGATTSDDAADPLARTVVLGTSYDDHAVWRGRPGRLLLEQWDLDGTLRSTVRLDPDWFRTEYSPGDPPPSRLLDFGVDREGRLWLVTNVADPDWREVMTPGRPVPAARIDGLFDSRIDVFDLGTRSHLGTAIWDQALVRILKTPRGLAVYRPQLTDDLVPKVVVYRLGDG